MRKRYTKLDKVFAWSVHVFTASGLLAGFMAIIAIAEKDFRSAMLWMFVSLAIDGIDGTFARFFQVSRVLPQMSGKTMDYVIDFTTYGVIPAYFFYSANLAPAGFGLPLSFLILLASALYYGKEGMVSPDFYFIGFPVMWNMVVFYLLFVFGLPPAFNAVIVLILAVMHFLPVKFAYPSRATRFKKLTLLFSAMVLVLVPLLTWMHPDAPVWARIAATLNLVYFGVLALVDTFRK